MEENKKFMPPPPRELRQNVQPENQTAVNPTPAPNPQTNTGMSVRAQDGVGFEMNNSTQGQAQEEVMLTSEDSKNGKKAKKEKKKKKHEGEISEALGSKNRIKTRLVFCIVGLIASVGVIAFLIYLLA